MTTVAYDGREIAADTLATSRGDRTGLAVKIAVRNGVFAAACGSAVHARRFLDWFRQGMKGQPPHMGDPDTDAWAEGTILPPGGRMILIHPRGVEESKIYRFWACGSGADFALGAMEAGARPADAVRIAALYNTATGGDVVSFRRDGPRLRLRRAR